MRTNKISMKIGIVTFHCSYNYGSVLQAYALQKFLSRYFTEVQVIDYKSRNFNIYKLIRKKSLVDVNLLKSDLKYLKKNMIRKKNFWSFIHNEIPLSNRSYTYRDDLRDDLEQLNLEYDAFICGSDQIWNAVCTGGLDPVFFLHFANKEKKKIAYAPSLAHNNFSHDVEIQLAEYIKALDAVSIREKSGKNILERLGIENVSVVLDPTMLLDADDYLCISNSKFCEKKYIFVYMLENDNESLIYYAKQLSKKNRIPIYYIHKNTIFPTEFAINYYGCSPYDFLSLIKNSTYIVTNSFHATVFSILFKKQFVTFKTEKSYSRMVDLLDTLLLSNRLFHDNIEIDTKINYDSVLKKLELMKKPSIDFLINSLSM